MTVEESDDDAEWMLVKLSCPQGHSHVALVAKGDADKYKGASLVVCPEDEDDEDDEGNDDD